VKPRQRRVELDYTFDSEAPHIDGDADYDMPHLTLTSQTVPPKANYAVALVRDGRAVLTPLHAFCRMLPSFKHVEKALEEERQDADRKKGKLPEEAAADDAPELAPVLVKFRRQQGAAGDRGPQRRVTYQYLRMLQEQEAWVDLKIHAEDATSSLHQHDKLVTRPHREVEFTMSAREYIEYIAPSAEIHTAPDVGQAPQQTGPGAAAAAPAARAAAVSFGVGGGHLMPAFGPSRSLSPEEMASKVLAVMLAARVASTRQLVHALNIKTAEDLDEMVLRARNYCYVVQGNWVVKSETIYNLKRVPAEYRRVLARNYAIGKFAENPVLSRAEVFAASHVDRDVMDQVMEELGTRVDEVGEQQSGKYAFKLKRDDAFIDNFADIVAANDKVIVKLVAQTDDLLKFTK
jgi:hypothetical protein